MRRLALLLPLAFALAAAPAFAQEDEPGSKDHPLVPRMPQYLIHSYEATDFDKAEFPLPDDKAETVEGKHWNIAYYIRENARHQSPLAILRNYQNAFRAKGGAMLFQDDVHTTLRLKTATGDLWCHISVSNDGEMYQVEIIEKTGMAQEIALNAAEIARALNETGSIALHDILFDTGQSTIKPESQAALALVGDVLKADAALRLEIQGHTDNVGAAAANRTLSQARAAAVRDYLIRTFAIAPARLTAAGYGDTKPIADNATEDGRAKNRRVELVKLTAAGGASGAQGANAARTWTGTVTAGMMAVGGETTGTILTVGQERFELEGATPALRQQLRDLDRKTVTVKGTLATRQGVEIPSRRIITVTEIVP